jgi:hypothetical protein
MNLLLLPDDIIQYIYSYLPLGYLDDLDKKRRSIKKAVGVYYPYGKRNTIYDMETAAGETQYEKQLIRYYRITKKMWKYADKHYCLRCLHHHEDTNNLVYCDVCGHGQCRRQYRNRNKSYGIGGIIEGRMVKKPQYSCPYCYYYNHIRTMNEPLVNLSYLQLTFLTNQI